MKTKVKNPIYNKVSSFMVIRSSIYVYNRTFSINLPNCTFSRNWGTNGVGYRKDSLRLILKKNENKNKN